MKKIIQIVLAVVVVVLAYVVYQQIMTPLRFQKEVKIRETEVIERIKDIRTAQRAYKQVHQKYTGSFDTLINFVLNDSLVYERAFGSADDSVAVAQNLVSREIFKVAAIDTLFGTKKYTPQMVEQLRYIPHGNGKQYIMDAKILLTESQVAVPVFVARAPYKDFLSDLDEQEVINLIDEAKNVYNKYPGIQVGSVERANNDAGNWE